MPRFAKWVVASLVVLLGPNVPAYGQHMRIEAVAHAPDGKVVLAGHSTDAGPEPTILVERLNADGTQAGNCFMSFGPADTAVVPTNVQVSDVVSTPVTLDVMQQSDPFPGAASGFVPSLCSTPGGGAGPEAASGSACR